MGRNGSRTMATVRVGGRSTAKMMTEGSREFCSVLESVSAVGWVLPPFIIWQGKIHRESYYPEGGLFNEATFAVSDGGYMDNELGLVFEGYPTEADPDFKESNVNDLVLFTISPILCYFILKTGRKRSSLQTL